MDLDSALVVGTITHWPKERFEVQYHSCVTGDVVVLEEHRFSRVEELNDFFEKLSRKIAEG